MGNLLVARNEQAKKVVVGWAASNAANRADIPTTGNDLTRMTGWPSSYSQPGGDDIMRQRINQALCEISSLFVEINTQGILEWSSALDYDANAVVRRGANFYRADSSTGPGTDRSVAATDPATTNTVWTQIFEDTPAP